MAELLVRRKLSRPRVSAPFFVREALRHALAEGLQPDRRLTLVCAGPGYGKTSTVADYVAQSSLPSAWLNLDPYDRDLEPFFTYLVRGVEANWPGYRSQSLALLQAAADKPRAIPAVVGALCEELAEWAPTGFVLVLDDFHAVEEAPGIVEASQALVDYLPEAAQLVLISRTVPPLRLGQLRARKQLIELGVEQLRLGQAEIRALVEALSGRRPDDAEVAWLQRLTEGWAASVVMAAQGAAQARIRHDAPLAGNDLIFDYLAQEVFEGLDAEGQEFLLVTSLLPTIDLDLCRRALGIDDAARHLERLRRRNLLLSREREDTIEFHYHPILRAFLQDRLRRTFPATRQHQLRLEAARALEESAPEDALDLYLDGELWAEAEATIRRIARSGYLDAGRLDALARLLDRFPASRREASPWLTLFEGEIRRLRGEFDRALSSFELAARKAEAAGDRSAWGQALALQAACLGSQGDSRLTQRARAALDVLPDDDASGQALAHNVLGLALQTQQPDAALAHLEQALEHYRRTGDVSGQIKVLHNLGLFHTRRGDFDQALAMYGESLRLAESAGRHGAPATFTNMANVRLYQGDHDGAWAAAAKGLDLAQRLGFRREEGWCFLTLAVAAKGGNDLARATGYAEDARSVAIALGDKALEAQAAVALAEIALQGGNPERAWELVQHAVAIRDLPPDDPGTVDFKIPAGRILLERGKAAEAEATLLAARDALEGSNLAYRQAQVLFLLARAQDALGRGADAATSRERARSLCEAHGYTYLLRSESVPVTVSALAPAIQTAPAPAPTPVDLEIRAFGTFTALRQGEPIPAKQWQGHKTKLILAYLLGHRQGVSRDQLAEILYGEELVSRSAILMLLSRLRQALEPDLPRNSPSRFIQFRDGRYYFNFGARYRADTEDFDFHLKEARQQQGQARIDHLQRALDLYTGRYLADLPGEHWVTAIQEHYHLQAMRAYDEVMNHHAGVGDLEAALAWADRCLAVDPCAESAHQTKIRALHLQGNRQGAIRHFQQMEQVLARELGIEPGEDSRALYEEILQG